jgi:hypothetical protein
MLLTDYTTYAEIRATLGVNEREIEDIDMSGPTLGAMVEERLYEMSPTALARYGALILAVPATPEEIRFCSLFKLYINYLAAKELVGPLMMYAPQSIEDGRAKTVRFAATPECGDNVRGVCSDLRSKLVTLINQLWPGEASVVDTSISLLGVVGLATDPVVQ